MEFAIVNSVDRCLKKQSKDSRILERESSVFQGCGRSVPGFRPHGCVRRGRAGSENELRLHIHVARFHASGYACFRVCCDVEVDGCDRGVFDEYLSHGDCEHPDEFGDRVHQHPDADHAVLRVPDQHLHVGDVCALPNTIWSFMGTQVSQVTGVGNDTGKWGKTLAKDISLSKAATGGRVVGANKSRNGMMPMNPPGSNEEKGGILGGAADGAMSLHNSTAKTITG